jgi:hypothetical protein
VLPQSPWLALAGTLQEKKKPSPRTLKRRDLLLPAAASALALALLVFAYHRWMPTVPDRPELPGGTASTTPRDQLARGRRLLDEGLFRLALVAMTSQPGDVDLKGLTSKERRAWHQVRRQAALLADLLSEPLEDIVSHGAGVKAEEWQADFRHRFLGKSLVLDAEFRRPPGGAWEVLYPLFHGRARARVVVGDLKILGAVPAQDPQRLVVGVRLASVKLEPPGPTWVVRFEPDSGVFLTEPTAAARVCPALAEPEGISILERQKRWIE